MNAGKARNRIRWLLRNYQRHDYMHNIDDSHVKVRDEILCEECDGIAIVHNGEFVCKECGLVIEPVYKGGKMRTLIVTTERHNHENTNLFRGIRA